MNLDPRDSQIHILLINIDSLSRKLAEVDEKSEELNLGQGHVPID